MKGYLTSYTTIFGEPAGDTSRINRIEIPLIQRDYAQGRVHPVAEEIRSDFLAVLFRALAGGEPVGLDFIYGKVEAGVFQPLDGQQRLTTLFLIHWYVASKAGQLDPVASRTRFTYETRPSARLFCESLVRHALPPDETSPAAWIRDQPWYLYTWTNDPTIQSMLVMIDAIDREARRPELGLDPGAAWDRLTAANPAVTFYLLPVTDMESEEDLYIKMNSRGKPLTEFENFKAHFEQDIRHSARSDDFAHRIDGTWADLMWPIHGGDNIVDDEFMRLIDYLTEICELRDDQVKSGRISPRARAVFGPENPKASDHLDFLFRVLDAFSDGQRARPSFVRDAFEDLFALESPGFDAYNPDTVVLFGASSVNLFERCCHEFDSQREGRRAFTQQDSLLLYAVLLHLVMQTDDFRRRVRVLRNLIAASAEDVIRRPNMPRLIKDIEAIIIDGDVEAVTTLSRNQVLNEIEKAAFIDAHPELSQAVFRLEDHPLLRGTTSAFELDALTFERRATAFETTFADPASYLQLTGALLATGDYQRRRPNTPSWQFGTAAPDNQAVWRYLLTYATSDGLADTRRVLGEFLDGLAASGTDLGSYSADVTAAWLAERESRTHFDWRYYLVKYPAMRGAGDWAREGKTGIYWGVDGELGYSLCMLRTYQLNGYYRDPFLLQVWLSSGVNDAVVNPWFSGYVIDERWLRLERSQVGLRCVAEGFDLEGPEDDRFLERFLEICRAGGVETMDDGRRLLRVPQVEHDGELIDSVNRVSIGSAFVKDLVDAGL